jgi:hypothetical protein
MQPRRPSRGRDRHLRSTVQVGKAAALYLEAVAGQVADDDLDEPIEVYSRRSLACGARPWTASDVLAPEPFRLYRATVGARSVLQAGDRRLPVRPPS